MLLMYHGHDPRAIREYPWRDVELFLDVYDVLDPFSGREGE